MWLLLFFALQSGVYAQNQLEPVTVRPESNWLGRPSSVVQPEAQGTLEDSLRDSIGLVIGRAGGPGQTSSLYLRGTSSEHTLVLLDGVEVNNPAHPAGGFDFSSIDTNLIERIEIFKGPQALRLGAGAMGGAINIVTKKGRGPLRAAGRLGAGSFNSNDQAAAIMAGSKKFDYALSAARFESDGISAAAGGGEKDGYRKVALAGRLGYSPNARTEISLISRYLRSRAELDYAPQTAPPYLTVDDPDYSSTSYFLTNALHIRRDWSDGFSSQFTAAQHNLELKFKDPPDRRVAGVGKLENVNNWKINPRLQLQFGPSHRRERALREMTTTGFFLSADYARGDFFLNAGERIDRHSRYGNFLSHQFMPGVFLPALQSTIKARYATGFKSPSLFQLYDSTFGDQNLKPERIAGQEAVWETNLSGGRNFAATLYRYHSQDLIQFGTRYQNIGEARTTGAEFEYAGPFIARTNFNFAYSYSDSRNLATGAALLRRPFHQWRAGLDFRIDTNLEARIVYRGNGRRPDLDAVTFTPAENPGFDTTDLALSWQAQPDIKLNLRAENIFDRRYQEILGYGAPGRAYYLSLVFE